MLQGEWKPAKLADPNKPADPAAAPGATKTITVMGELEAMFGSSPKKAAAAPDDA